jgi:hypothetical protein
MTAHVPLTDVAQLLAAIGSAAAQEVGVNSYEDLLIELLGLLRSDRVGRADAVSELERLVAEWSPGAAEALEFTMHELRWPEIRRALEDHQANGVDFRTRNLAGQVLQAFEDDWPEGDIYRTYRPS